jgi:hypothetical protein
MSESQNPASKPGVGSRHASAAAGSCSTVEADQGAWPRRVGTDVAPAGREGPAHLWRTIFHRQAGAPFALERPASRKDALSSPGRSHLANCNGMDGAALPCGRLGRRWQHEGLSTRRQSEGHRSRSGSEDGGDTTSWRHPTVIATARGTRIGSCGSPWPSSCLRVEFLAVLLTTAGAPGLGPANAQALKRPCRAAAMFGAVCYAAGTPSQEDAVTMPISAAPPHRGPRP